MIKYFFAISLFLVPFNLLASEEAKYLLNIEKQINSSHDDQVQLSIEKNQLETQIKEIQAKIKDKKILIVKRLKALYSLNRFKWGELLLNDNLNELERNVKILENLNKYDYNLFKEYNASFRNLALSRKNLQETEGMILKNVENLKTQQAEFHKLEAIRIASLKKEKLVSLLIEKGRLTRPLDGYLKQEFGSLRDIQNQFYLINRGELYTAKIHSPVKSIGLGTIIFRDELVRWRETLIIQHDDNYYSVYAGVVNSKKTVGEQIEKNELVGVTAGEEFYFELRHFDNPINPKSWYKE